MSCEFSVGDVLCRIGTNERCVVVCSSADTSCEYLVRNEMGLAWVSQAYIEGNYVQIEHVVMPEDLNHI